MRPLLALGLLLTCVPVSAKEILPFIENDFGKAVAQAKTKQRPIFVDAWAPW